MPRGIKSAGHRGASRTTDTFLVRFPGDARVLKFNDKMIRRREMVDRWIAAAIRHAPIRAGLQPKILRQTAKRPRHDVHVAGVRGLWNKEIVDERRIRAARDIRPTHILHHDEKDGVDVRITGRTSRGRDTEDRQGNKSERRKPHIVRSFERLFRSMNYHPKLRAIQQDSTDSCSYLLSGQNVSVNGRD